MNMPLRALLAGFRRGYTSNAYQPLPRMFAAVLRSLGGYANGECLMVSLVVVAAYAAAWMGDGAEVVCANADGSVIARKAGDFTHGWPRLEAALSRTHGTHGLGGGKLRLTAPLRRVRRPVVS